jgi:hypothetical protein
MTRHQTTIRLTEQDQVKLDDLIEAGHAQTLQGIISLALDRMYQEEIRHKTLSKSRKSSNAKNN